MADSLDQNEIARLAKLKNKERMAIPRQPMPEQEAAVRRNNFDEVPRGLPPMVAVTEANRCIQCKKPKCISGCPVGIDIPAFNGDDSFVLPVPASYVIDRNGSVRYRFVNVDYTQRLEPDELLGVLRGQ